MGAQLAGTVYVKDPETHRTVRLDSGTSPEPRLAALVTNPGAWVDGKLPSLPKTKSEEGDSGPSGNGPGVASGGDSGDSGTADTLPQDDPPTVGDESEDTKPAARKTAAKRPARGRTTADEGTGGQ